MQNFTKSETQNEDIMNDIRKYHHDLEQKLGDEQYTHNDQGFQYYINDDVPDSPDSVLYSEPYKIKPYQGL